jgi:hypothetical protein
MSSCRRPWPPHFPPLRPVAASSSVFVLRMVGAESADEFGIVCFINASPADGMEGREETQNDGSNEFNLCCYKVVGNNGSHVWSTRVQVP